MSQTIFQQIDQAYNDNAVKELPELQELLFAAAQDLTQQEPENLVASRLTKQLATYSFTHKNKIPAAIATLYNQLMPLAAKYDGVAMSAIMLSAWSGN